MRIETDYLGEMSIPSDALYGIHSLRAKQNFPNKTSRFHIEWFQSIGAVKKSCYLTYKKFKKESLKNFMVEDLKFNIIDDNIVDALIESADEVYSGMHFNHFIIPGISGGAGTSINMNINEIITNRSLQKLGHNLGDYSVIDPIEHANIFQSTNDTIPTALKVATMQLLDDLETSINELRESFEKLERKSRDDLRVAYTQMQEAVPSSYGKLFSTYQEALSRDWWRVSKCFERIKVVNIGGSAVGTGITTPKFFIFEVINELRALTQKPVTRGDNLEDATCNLDSIVEVHAIMKSHAVNLEKITSDIRLLASDIHGTKEVTIPSVQVGSSIMPGKVNPVISEFAISTAHNIYANDSLISGLAALGTLDLNPYLPAIGQALLTSLKDLIGLNQTVKQKLIDGIVVNKKDSNQNLTESSVITTALIPYLGYNKSSEIAKLMKKKSIDIFEANGIINFMDDELLRSILVPSNLLKLGYSLREIEKLKVNK